jgi:hypothetical protein
MRISEEESIELPPYTARQLRMLFLMYQVLTNRYARTNTGHMHASTVYMLEGNN